MKPRVASGSMCCANIWPQRLLLATFVLLVALLATGFSAAALRSSITLNQQSSFEAQSLRTVTELRANIFQPVHDLRVLRASSMKAAYNGFDVETALNAGAIVKDGTSFVVEVAMYEFVSSANRSQWESR